MCLRFRIAKVRPFSDVEKSQPQKRNKLSAFFYKSLFVHIRKQINILFVSFENNLNAISKIMRIFAP